jgi:diguanylate cyclase (GGDEF)-like protein
MRVLVLFLLMLRLLYANHDPIPLSVQLSWLHQFQFAGFYVAKEKGFYEQYDLNVTFKERTPQTDIVQSVLSGESDFGVDKSSLMLARAEHKPVVALMALFQHSPSVLLSIDPALKEPKDLKNKRIMMLKNQASAIEIMAMLLSGGITSEDYLVHPQSFRLDDLLSHRTDAMAAYLSNEPFVLQERHIPYTILNPKDYGFDFYGDILFTSEALLKHDPEQVKKFYWATKKGWEWAFEHIEETARLIFEHYNTQHKSLEALIYEGNTLRKLAYNDSKPFGLLEKKKFDHIAHVYRFNGYLIDQESFEGFIDPLHFAKDTIRIGVLASREGDEVIPISWRMAVEYLNEIFPAHRFVLMPLSFEGVEESIKNNEVDFIITNPVQYIQLEHAHGISRLATMSTKYKDHYYSEYGSVVFTRSDSDIHTFKDAKGKKIGAVAPSSLGGYLLGRKALGENFDLDKVSFLETHHNVVKAVLNKSVDVGIIRTDTLEKLSDEKIIDLKDFRILGLKKIPSFPFMSSTDIYPEWTFAKTVNTSEDLANEVISTLFKLSTMPQSRAYAFRLKTPQDYSKVHAILKEFGIPPHEREPFTLIDALLKFRYLFLGLLMTLITSLIFLAYIQRLNDKLRRHAKQIERFNETLEREVDERTHALTLLNAKLKELANTDELTKIDNRRHFLLLATQYFYAAKRNKSPLHILSLDIDWFKNVNDTYGHAVGDDVLKFFTQQILTLIRESDLFGRVGGEEFAICLQNTSHEGALTLAEKIRSHIESSTQHQLPKFPPITVSIGISSIHEEDDDVFDIMKRADKALYKAKNNGRNQVQFA